MDSKIVIAIFTLPSELTVVKSLLEANGIECIVKDELTIQVHNFISNALGGIRMIVEKEDYERAKTLIIDNGFAQHLVDYGDEGTMSKSRTVQNLKLAIRGIVVLSVILILWFFYMLLTR